MSISRKLHPATHSRQVALRNDTDEARLRRGEGVHCPLVSSVLYLEAGGGAPTLVAEQRYGDGELAQRGWLAQPARGRLLMFEGSLLHGVLPAFRA